MTSSHTNTHTLSCSSTIGSPQISCNAIEGGLYLLVDVHYSSRLYHTHSERKTSAAHGQCHLLANLYSQSAAQEHYYCFYIKCLGGFRDNFISILEYDCTKHRTGIVMSYYFQLYYAGEGIYFGRYCNIVSSPPELKEIHVNPVWQVSMTIISLTSVKW